MIVFKGFEKLVENYKSLPDVGWLYVDNSFDLNSKNDIVNGKYYIAENEDEEMDFEENYGTFLEAPIFKAIVESTLEKNAAPSNEDFLKAAVYYLENDDFQD